MSTLKILHRIYFGFDGKADPYLDYLETWKDQLPNYQIMYWNAENLPIDICDYTKELYKERDHVFLSDYFRWWVLREYGGAYLDADIEIVNGELFNSIIEELETAESYDSIIGIESPLYNGYTTHSMASKKNSYLCQFMCDIYETMGVLRFFRRISELFLSPQIISTYFFEEEISGNGFIQSCVPVIIKKVKIYPFSYFSPLRYIDNNTVGFNPNTDIKLCCLCHHFSGSWKNKNQHKTNMMLQHYINNDAKTFFPLIKHKIKDKIVIISKKISLYNILHFFYKILNNTKRGNK